MNTKPIVVLVLLTAAFVCVKLNRQQPKSEVAELLPSCCSSAAANPQRLTEVPLVDEPRTPLEELTPSEVPPTAEVLWQKPSPLLPMAEFQEWAKNYAVHPEREGISEGVRLAKTRRIEMRRLIQQDPEQALANAVPESVRRAMPPQVQALLEDKIDSRGNLLVTAASYLGGQLPEGKSAVSTKAQLSDGREFDAYTYGNREYQPSKTDVPIHGVALDEDLAVSEWPGRILEPIEQAEVQKPAGEETVCEVSEQPTTSTATETVLLTGTALKFFCAPSHASYTLQLGAANEAASGGGDGTVEPSGLSRAPVGWTTGTHRMLLARVNFKAADPAGTNYHQMGLVDCITLIDKMREALDSWSYGRLTIPGVSGSGSWVLPTMVLSKAAKDYEGDEMGDIWDEVWEQAEAQGYSKSTYDYLVVVAGNAPFTDETSEDDKPVAVDWGGKGRIGQGLSILRVGNGSWTSEDRVAVNTTVGLHELGHNFGLAHASSLILMPPDSPIPAVFSEYGDRYDNMGNSDFDYNARFKHWLRWLDNPSLPVTNKSGVFTIREHDLEENAGIRGLHVDVPGTGDDLFIEYRLRGLSPVEDVPNVLWNDQLRAYGAMLRLARSSTPKSWLVDATPETTNIDPDSAGNLDCPLLPGRTYQAGSAFVTNLGADPEAGTVKLEVQYGPLPGNSPPVGSIITSSETAGLRENFIFTADVTDAEDTDFAYNWEVPSMNVDWRQRAVFSNSPSIMVQFQDQGPRTVFCRVSDKHGGVVFLEKTVTVIANTAPTITAISDKVMDEDTTIYVPFTIGDETTSPSALAVSFTCSDPTLISSLGMQLGGTGADRTLGITPRPNRHGTAVITVTVFDGSFLAVESFAVTVKPVTPGTTLVAFGSNGWRYWATTPAPVGDWKSTTFIDALWPEDNARFTYPAPMYNLGGTRTVLPGVPGRVTCYFRKTFTMPASPGGTPMIRLVCDDGAVVYVNGTEVYRHNMPEGAVDSGTLALTSVEGSLENAQTVIPFSADLLVNGGSNVIAVEVHDTNGVRNAGDVEFDLEFGLTTPPIVISGFTTKTVNEDQVAGPYDFYAVDFESGGGPLNFVVTSSNQNLVNNANIVVTEKPTAGQYSLTMTPQPDASGSTDILLRISDGQAETWRSFTLNVTPVNDPPRMDPIADRTVVAGAVSHFFSIRFTDPDSNPALATFTATSSSQAVLNNSGLSIFNGPDSSSRVLRVTPNAGIEGQTTITLTANDGLDSVPLNFILRTSLPISPGGSDMMLIREGANWRYSTTISPNGEGGPLDDFTAPDFDDSKWPRRAAQIYINDSGSGAISALPYRITTYFRREFECGPPSSITRLNLRMQRDDGAAVYLNGNPVWFSNVPDKLTPTTLALSDVDGADEETWHEITIGPEYLVPGRNVVAVELHQSQMPTNHFNTDLTFDFEMTAVPNARTQPAVAGVIIPSGDNWSYWDRDVSSSNAAWRNPNADASTWSQGLAAFGYGYGNESTVVNRYSGPYTNASVLFRKFFDVADPDAYTALHLFIARDDGAVVYLNGIRIIQDNVDNNSAPSYPDPTPSQKASWPIPPGTAGHWHHFSVNPKRLFAGRNFIAVSVHQSSLSETDLYFDLQLTGELDLNPTIHMNHLGDHMELRWSAAYTGWRLRVSDELARWRNGSNAPVMDGPWMRTTEPITGRQGFYQLVTP